MTENIDKIDTVGEDIEDALNLRGHDDNDENDSDEENFAAEGDLGRKLDDFEIISREFVFTVLRQVQDVATSSQQRDPFVELLASQIKHIAKLSKTTQSLQGHLNSLLEPYVKEISYKAGFIADTIANEITASQEQVTSEDVQKLANSTKRDLMAQICSTFGEALKNAQIQSFSPTSANLLIQLGVGLHQYEGTKGEPISPSALSVQQMCKIGHHLLSNKNSQKTQLLDKLVTKVFNFLMRAKFDFESLKALKSRFAVALLAQYFGTKNNNSDELLDLLTEKSNSLVFDDKREDAFQNAHYLKFFYRNLTESQLLSKVISEAQFASKKEDKMVRNVAQLAENLTISLSYEGSVQLVKETLSANMLVAESAATCQLLSSVCKKVRQEDWEQFENELFRKTIWGLYDQIRGDLAVPHQRKMLAINSLFACLQARKSFGKENTQKVLEEFIDLLLASKEEVDIPQNLTTFFGSLLKDNPEISKQIGEKSQKLLSGTQISFVEKLCADLTPEIKSEIIESCTRTLTTVNLQSATAFNVNLALVSIINSCGGLKQLLTENQLIVKFLCSPASVINNESFWAKNPSRSDVGHHLTLLGELSKSKDVFETSAGQWRTLIKTFINYATSDEYIYRDSELSAISNVFAKNLTTTQLTQILEALFVKQTLVLEKKNAQKPEKAAATQEYDGRQKESSMLVSRRISKVILILLEGFTTLENIDYNLLSLILQSLSHEIASPNKKALQKSFRKLQKLFGEERLTAVFSEHNEQLINQFMKSREGLLCPMPKVRNIAINILTCVGWAGFLEQILANVEPLINYKPIQMLDKFEQLLNQEFETMSHYDLMAYADLTKGLLKMYDSSDEKITEKALRLDSVKQAEAEEEKKEAEIQEVAAPVQIQADLEKPIDLAAALKLKMKSKKTAKGSKKAKKGKTSAAASKPVSVAASTSQPSASASSTSVTKVVKEESSDDENLGKEERNKKDRKRMIRFVDQMRNLKATQVSSVLEILKNSCDCPMADRLSYQDKTLNVTLNSIIKLLSLPSTRFATQNFFSTVLGQSQNSPFFKIKSAILTCFLAIAKDRLTHSITQEFQNCLVFLEESTEFGDMEGGYLQLTLTIANYVLKDPSVNLSVKEIGLMVTQSILESNNNVQIVDIVRLTINMLKTNYISKNLSLFLKKLLQRCSKIEIAMLLQRIFDYQPVPRQTFLQEILVYDEALFSPVWLQTQLWMLLFDDELSTLARKIWNRFGLYLRTEVISLQHESTDRNLFHYMRSQNTSVFNFTIQASASAIEMLQYVDQSSIIADLESFYDSEWVQIEMLSIQACEDDIDKDQAVQKELIGDERINRIAVPKILEKISSLIQVKDFESVLSFLVTKACLDQNSEVQEASSDAAIHLIKAQGPQNANALLAILEKFLTSTEGPSATVKAKNQACILLASLAPFLADTSVKKVSATFEHLVTLCHETQSEMFRKSISKCIPQLSRYFPDKAKMFLSQQLVLIRESKDERALKGVAYVAAGLFKQRGLKAFADSNIIEQLGKENFVAKKSDHVRKIASLNLFECLAFVLGRSFELFLDQVFPHILGSISDQREVVRDAAISALKVIMGNFTNYAIKQALPQFLAQLETDNWRSKISTVEALGNMAYCAPKQISSFLPQIVKGLREVMNDTHEKVHESAIQAISKIGSVIKCPEVGDMLQIIIRALSNTSKYLNECLKLLLETSFVHAIDAPSLSLLVPLLDSGLMMYDNQAKQMASQLMGNICSLTKDPSDLLPYMSILMPATKNALFDAIPEIRASAAKAMGSLSKGLGIENSMEMLGWLREHLHMTGIAQAEKLGAAQGFAELISVQGDEYFDMNVQEVVIKANDKEAEIRESYRTVLIFLPNSYLKFVDKLQSIMPLLIEGLADDLDEVRKVSMRTIKICIKKFGREAPNQLVMPIMRMMFSPDYRVRQSSSILMYQLVKELENDIIKANPKYVNMDTKYRILSSMFILKYDQIERVQTQAGQIWKNIVDNQLIVLRQIIDTLIQLVFQIIQSQSIELQEMGLACMRGLVEKFGEKLVNRALDIFERFLDTATESNQTIGICKVMYNMVSASSFRLLQMISPRMISILEDNLASEDEDIRNWSANVFITMFQRQPDKNFIDPTMDKCILYKLKMFVRESRHEEASRLIISLKYLIFRAPELRLQDRLLQLCEITKRDQPFSVAQALVLRALAPTIAPKVFHTRLYTTVLNSLEEELTAETIDDEVRLESVMVAYAELIACIPQQDIKLTEEVIYRFYGSCSELRRPAFYLDLMSNYCTNSASEIEHSAHIFLENCLMYINHPDEKVISKLIKAIESIFARVSKETQFTLIPILRESIERQCVDFLGGGSGLLGYPTEHRYKKKVESLALLKTPAGQKALVEVIQAAIMHGNVQVRIDSAFCFKYLLDFAPTLDKKEIIKICGALIRVANDKFSQELKLQIFYALRFIQIKGAVAAKGFQIQLQTTFLKALGDPQSSYAARRVVIENLVLLIKGVVRVDPIVKELNSLIEGVKIDGEQKMCVSECLALVIRAKGKAITSAQSANIYKTLTEILADATKGAINDKVLANCATALGFLSAYSNEATQMIQLFDAFDEEANDAICLPLKFAILANGNEKVDKAPLAASMYEQLKERLVDGAGFEEIDDDPAPLGEDEGCFRFKGVLELVGHFMDKYARRDWCQSPDSIYTRGVLETLLKSGIFAKLQQEDSICGDSYVLLNKFLASIPVKCAGKSDNFCDELQEVIRQALEIVRKFYLDHEGLNQNTCDSLINIFGLNYDNYLELTGENAFILTKPMLKDVLKTKPCLQGVISDDMKLYAVDILFKKK